MKSTGSLAMLNKLEKERLHPMTLGIVKKFGRQEKLNLNFGISDRYAGAFSKGLQHIRSLEKIGLKGNRLSKSASLKILNHINSPSLKSIDLSGNNLG